MKVAFSKAVEDCVDIAECFRSGLQALGANSKFVRPTDTRKVEGSVDLDGCLKDRYPQANRWDYVIGYAGKAYMVEVHPTTDGQIKMVIKKAEWLKQWLATNCSGLKELTATPFIWISTGRNGILKTSNQARMLAKSGVSFPMSVLKL